MSTKLEEARAFEAKFLNIKDDSKPGFHAVVPVGWMNDPNGFSEFKKEYHLFFQYHPYSTQWGPMHWGHCMSKDFIKWDYMPAVLAPEESYDLSGCFSGTAFEDGDEHLIAYTGVYHEKEGENYVGRQVQCLATGNGKEYIKNKSNPVITADMIDEEVLKTDFRDPKIWKENGKYYMAVACANKEGLGRIALFEAEDIEKWKYKQMLARNDGSLGSMWECPDVFKIDGKEVLVISGVGIKNDGKELFDGHYSFYFIDGGEALGLDYGFDFYAPQSLLTSDGRRVMIAWMQMWYKEVLPESLTWNGSMTIPRELKLVDGRLLQLPVREIERYRTNRIAYLEQTLTGENELAEIEGREIDLEIELLKGEYTSLEIQLAQNDDFCIKLKCEGDKIIFDRSCTDLRERAAAIRVLRLRKRCTKLRVLLDKYSAEVFINDGEAVITSLFSIPLDAKGVKFVVDGELVVNINKYDIKI